MRPSTSKKHPPAIIRRMTQGDTSEAARVHMEGFPGFFLTFLGHRFIAVMYRSILDGDDAIAHVAVEEDGTLLGLMVGTSAPQQIYRRLARDHVWEFAWASLGAVARKPVILPRLVRALRRQSNAEGQEADALMMSLAVSPSARGRDLGRALMCTALADARRRGCRTVALITDRDHNDHVNHFHQAIGFKIVRTFATPEGRYMNEYMLDLTQTPLFPEETGTSSAVVKSFS